MSEPVNETKMLILHSTTSPFILALLRQSAESQLTTALMRTRHLAHFSLCLRDHNAQSETLNQIYYDSADDLYSLCVAQDGHTTVTWFFGFVFIYLAVESDKIFF